MAQEAWLELPQSEADPGYSPEAREFLRGESPTRRLPVQKANVPGVAEPSYLGTLTPEDKARVERGELGDVTDVTGYSPEALKFLQEEQAPQRVFIDPDSIRKAQTLSATLDIPFSQAHLGVKTLSAEMDRQAPGWFTVEKQLGFADVYDSIGGALKAIGLTQMGEDYRYYSQKLRHAYMPYARQEEFSFRNVTSPEWLARTIVRNVPSFLSLLPAAVIGAELAGAGATVFGLSMAAKYILQGAGASVVAAIFEAGQEAGQTYNEIFARTGSDKDATDGAQFTFNRNVVLLTGSNALELATGFFPLKYLGPTVNKMISRRIIATAVKTGFISVQQSGEEMAQTGIQQLARGEKVRWTPEMAESAVIGAIFGAAVGGPMSVYTALTDRIERNMPEGMREEYQADKVAGQAMGKSETEATRDALDNVASHPEGQAVIEKTMKELNDIGEGKLPPMPQPSEMESEIDKAAERPGEPEEVISDEQLDAIASGEQSIEDIFQLEEMAPRTPEEMAREEETVQVLREGEAVQVPVGVPEGPPLPDVVTRKGEPIFVSEERYQQALAELKEKTTGLHAGVDPTAIKQYAIIGAYHIERGVRTFAAWSKTMVEKFGEEIRPYLRKIWREAKKLVQTPATENQSLSLFVKNSGGIDLNKVDPGVRGEYEALLQEGGRKARDFIKRGKGLSPDEMSQIAAESEFIEEADTALLAEALKADLRGDKVYSARSELFERKTELQAERDVEAEAELRGRELAEQQEREAAAEPVDMTGFEEFEAAVESAARGQRMEKEVGRRVAAVPEARFNVPAGRVKQAIRLTTGQQRVANMIREDVALKAAFQKAQENARIAYKAGTKDALDKAKADFRDLLIKAQAKAETFGFREGFKVAEKLTRKDLIQAFRDQQADIKATQKMIRDYIEENLPPEMRGKFLDALILNLTKRKQESVMARVDQLAEKLERQDLIEQLGELKEYDDSISLDYQRRLTDLLKDIDTKNISQKTLEKLAGLQAFAEREGMPSGVSPRMLGQLQRLSQIPAASLTTEQLQELVDIGNHLRAMGQLKLKLLRYKKQRERDAARKVLVNGSNNLDAVTKNEAAKKGWEWSMYTYIQTLSPYRVGEMIDGFKEGPNAKMVKEAINRETDAQWEGWTRTDAAAGEIYEQTGIEKFTDDLNVRLMINIRALEGANAAVERLMEHYGYAEIPPLTEQEAKIIPILEKYTNMDRDEIAALHEERTNTPFVKLPRYILPLKYEGEFIQDMGDAMLEHGHRMVQTAQGFTEERVPGVKKLPRVDVMGVFEQGIKERTYYLQMQPWIDNVKYLVKSKEYLAKAGRLATQFWADYLDVVARRGWSASANSNDFNNMLRAARGNMNTAILGYKVSSIIMQPFAIFDAMGFGLSRYGPHVTRRLIAEMTKAWIKPGYAKQYIETSRALQTRKGGEVAIDETLARLGKNRGTKEWLIKNGLSLMLKADVRTAAGVQAAFEKILTEEGIPNPKREAELFMRLAQSSSEVTFRPLVLARGESARTMFTFATFFLNRWGVIAHDLIAKNLINKSATWKMKYSAMLGLGIMIAAKLSEDEARAFIYELFTGKRLKMPSVLQRAIYALPSSIPGVGQIWDSYKVTRGTSEIPIQRVIEDFFAGFVNPTSAKAWTKSLEAAVALRFGIPGTAQTFDVIEGTFFAKEGATVK